MQNQSLKQRTALSTTLGKLTLKKVSVKIQALNTRGLRNNFRYEKRARVTDEERR